MVKEKTGIMKGFSLFSNKIVKRSPNVKSSSGSKKTLNKGDFASGSALLRSRAALQAKIPTPEPLSAMLHEIVYIKPFSQVNKDILRLIRRVTIVKRTPGKPDTTITPAEEEKPDRMVDHPKESVYIVLILMQHLLRYFEEEKKANELINKLDSLYHDFEKQEDRKKNGPSNSEEVAAEGSTDATNKASGEDEAHDDEDEDIFTVVKLIEVIGGDKTRTALAVRCIHQSVAISGHMHIKAKVCPYMTKDVRSSSGWQVQILLSDPPHAFVQVTHTRRESSVDLPGQAHNHWELEFKVAVTFDSRMKELTGSRLEVTDLEISEAMERELEGYLTDRFKGGHLVVC